MADTSPPVELSPLDQIRLVETDVTRKIVAAREACEERLTEIHGQAALLKQQAHESGEHKGQIRYKTIIAEAEDEARMMIGHAHQHADGLRRKGNVRMELVVQEAISIFLDTKGGEDEH